MNDLARRHISGSDERKRPDVEQPMLDLGALARGIWRKRAWIAAATLLGFLAALAFVATTKARYTSTAKVFLESKESYFTRPSKDTNPEQQPVLDAEAVESQVELVTSRDLGRRAVEKLGLAGNAEFDPLANGMSPLTRVLVMLGIVADPRDKSPQDRILDAYFSRLTVYSVVKTRVLAIEFSSWDPDLSARAANTIAELYLQMQQDARKTTAKSVDAWLEPNIRSLRDKVADAESKVEAFRAQSGLLIGNNNLPITTQQLADLTTQVAAARAAEASAEAKAKLIRDLMRQGRVAELTEVANNDLIRAVAQQRVTLQSQLALESRTLLPGHPRIKELTAQLADIDNALRQAGAKVAIGLENDARLARARVEALQTSLKDQQRTVTTDNGAAVRLHALERDATAVREQLESLLAKDREANVRDTGNLPTSDGRVISGANAPEFPSFPKKVPTLVIGTLAGFFLSLGLVATRELLAVPTPPLTPPTRNARPRPLRRRRERLVALPESLPRGREKALPQGEQKSSPPLGETSPPRPAEANAAPLPPLPAAGRGQAAAASADIARIVESIAVRKPEGHASCVLICALDHHVDIGAAALLLGRDLAFKGHALLIDIHGGGHAFEHVVDIKDGHGLTDLLHHDKAFDDVIYPDLGSGLHILPIGHFPETVGDDEVRLNLAIDALIVAYDYVVFESPALADSDASLDLAAWTDISVLVSMPGSRVEEIEIGLDVLEEAGAIDVQSMEVTENAADGLLREVA